MAEIRRHPLFLSDREILVLERAVWAYASVMRIQTGSGPTVDEAEMNAKVGALIQEHRHCDCAKGG